jgi:hypothetical protein
MLVNFTIETPNFNFHCNYKKNPDILTIWNSSDNEWHSIVFYFFN